MDHRFKDITVDELLTLVKISSTLRTYIRRDAQVDPDKRCKRVAQFKEACGRHEGEADIEYAGRLNLHALNAHFPLSVEELSLASNAPAHQIRQDHDINPALRRARITHILSEYPLVGKDRAGYARRLITQSLYPLFVFANKELATSAGMTAWNLDQCRHVNAAHRAEDIRALVATCPPDLSDVTTTVYACRLYVHAMNHHLPLTLRELAKLSGAPLGALLLDPRLNPRMRAARMDALMAEFSAQAPNSSKIDLARAFFAYAMDRGLLPTLAETSQLSDLPVTRLIHEHLINPPLRSRELARIAKLYPPSKARLPSITRAGLSRMRRMSGLYSPSASWPACPALREKIFVPILISLNRNAPRRWRRCSRHVLLCLSANFSRSHWTTRVG
jgi:hypothetical protein